MSGNNETFGVGDKVRVRLLGSPSFTGVIVQHIRDDWFVVRDSAGNETRVSESSLELI